MEFLDGPLGLPVFFIFFGLIALLLSIGHLRARRPAPVEHDKTPIHTAWAGGTVGMVSYRGPLLNFRVYDNFLILDGWQRVTVHFANVDRIELNKPWPGIGTYLQIVHHQPDAPARIRLSLSDPERVKALIDAKLPRPNTSLPRIA